MQNLSIFLFGKPQITLDGLPVTIPTARAIPIIAYLAITGESQSRETLATLLWSDSTQKQALAALRTTLWRLKSAGLEDWITLDRNEIKLNHQKNIEIDVINFKALLDKCGTHGHPLSQICLYCTPALTAANGLYRGEFMSGFNISKAPNFDDWRMQHSEILHAQHLDALERLVKCHRTFGDLNLAIHYARLWLNYDRLNENAYYQLLQLYSITGQRTAGISLYKHYKQILARELGVEPTDELTSLYKQLQAGQITPKNDHRVKNPVFLIVEIENPAQYWAKSVDRKDYILTTNHSIIRDTARRFGGRIIQKSDESVTLLFENGQPLHCAVTIHLKLRNADWEQADPPSIRMVLYSTIVEDTSSSSFAMLTRTASSLLSITWGGQVVFTEQTIRLLDIPSGSEIKDLGFHFIDDLQGPIHVFELVHPNLPQREHPPLRSRVRPLINFPILSPAFVGREKELGNLVQLIKSPENRLISLVGPGGIGKTRLAVQFASQVASDFPDGIYFIPLASIQDPDFIPILVAEAIKYNFYGPQNQVEQLGRFLHHMKVMLVMDNFEHLRQEGSKFLSILLQQTHHLKILLTTRERLNMIAESILEVQGLPVPTDGNNEDAESYSSIRLFIHNAHKSYPRFSYTDNLAAIIRICKQVDGIPLGILLASSWVRVFSCDEIADEIKHNIDLLSTSSPDIDPRHRSLWAVFDHSWELLSIEERRILRHLSIFTSAFTSQAAQEICEASQLSLAVFADKSLLLHRQDNRYEMLSTFHLYARSKLEEAGDEFFVTQKNFCEYYAHFCAQKYIELNTAFQRRAIDTMISEIENIRSAWSWMVDLGRWDLVDQTKELMVSYHIILGNYIQAREFFHHALAKLDRSMDPGQDLIRAGMLMRAAYMTIKSGFISQGIPDLDESLNTFRQHNSRWDIVEALLYLAEAYRAMHQYQQAKGYIEEALVLLHDNTSPKEAYAIAFTAHCQSIFGLILMELGDYEQARVNLSESLTVHTRLGTSYGTINPLTGLGRLAFIQAEFVQARDLYLKALETALNIYDQHGMALIHNNLAGVYEAINNFPEAHHHMASAIKLCLETGDQRLLAIFINNMAYHQMKHLHQPTEAIRTYQECLEIFHEIGDLRGLTYTSYDISRAYLTVGLVDEARNYCLRSMQTAMTLDNPALILHSLHGFVYLFIYQNNYERALRLCSLIIQHPAVEPDTQKRAIVSRGELESKLPLEVVNSARTWAETANLTDVIDQILTETKSRLI
jgi:predicted ATPase/DNA-binding SARP family transcriptional activator